MGFQKLGCTMKMTPKKNFFLPEKAVVARFARASLADTGREAKRAGVLQKKFLGRVEREEGEARDTLTTGWGVTSTGLQICGASLQHCNHCVAPCNEKSKYHHPLTRLLYLVKLPPPTSKRTSCEV